MIKTIPIWKMFLETKGKTTGIAILTTLPIFIGTGIAAFFYGLKTGQYKYAIPGFLCASFFLLVLVVFIFPQTEYIPGKTFLGYRSKLKKSQSIIKYSGWFFTALGLAFSIFFPSKIIITLTILFNAYIALYLVSKSLKFHEDVDHSTNHFLSSSLGIDTDEKILVSYQNFEPSDIKEGCNAFIVTPTKLMTASFNENNWKKLSRNLDQITHIGVISDDTGNSCVKLIFSDGADVLLRITLYEKLSSNPTLVTKRLLEAIDANLLGHPLEEKAPRRRRVVTSNENSPTPVSTPETRKSAPTRELELTPAHTEPPKSGRKLEL